MAKNKAARKAEKKKKAVQRKKTFEGQKRALESAQLLKRNFLQKIRPATKNHDSIISRFVWNGMPEESPCDPFGLSGMEHLYVTYPDESSKRAWIDETQVSLVKISTYLGSEKSPNRGVYHRYEGSIIQMIDPTTSYGTLLTQQNHTGHFNPEDCDAAVVERKVHFILSIDKPAKEEARLFTQWGMTAPLWMLLDILIPLRATDTYQDISIIDQLRTLSLEKDLSDLEIDRLFEISAEIAAWIAHPSLSIEQRRKEKHRLEVELEAILIKIEPLRENLEVQELILESSTIEQEKLTREMQDKKKVLDSFQREVELEMASASLRRSNLENEKRRLEGVHQQLMENNRRSESNTKLAERIAHVQRERALIPARLREVDTEIDELQKKLANKSPLLQRAYEEAKTRLESEVPGHQVLLDKVATLTNEMENLNRQEQTIRSRLFYYR
jgi:hypothetical protein